MASTITYFGTAKIGHCRITAGVVNTDGSGASTPITWYGSAPSSDWMLVKANVSATSATGAGDLADCLLHMFVDDGATNRLVKTWDLGNPAAGSTITSGYQTEISFGPEWIFTSTVLPEFAVSVTPTAGNLDIVVFTQVA